MNLREDKSQPMKLPRNLSCANCNAQFFLKDFSLKGSRCPMLLQCGHSVCEPCLQHCLKEEKKITCQVCSLVSVPDSGVQTTDSFPLSIYMLGNLLAVQNHKYERGRSLEFLTKNSGNFNYSLKRQHSSNSQPEVNKSVCEECSMVACWYCENCKSNFCELCWTKVHGSARSLMKHCKTAICAMEKTGLKKCPDHETQDLEFFCRSCSTTICSHCIILQHQGEGHCPITLKEKNMEMIGNVKSAAEMAEITKKRMKQTLEKVKLTQISCESADNKLISDFEIQIKSNFSRIHGILQLEEERCLKKLREKTVDRAECLKGLSKKLETQMKSVESLLGEYDYAVKKPQFSDLTQLHKQLEEVQHLPCYLISQNGSEAKKAKITFNEEFVKSVHTYCCMDLPPSETFQLCSGADLPHDYTVEPLEDVDFYQEQKMSMESSVSDIDTWSNCSSREFSKGDMEVSSLSKEPSSPKVFRERRNYSVRVTYIKNPEEFYVMPNSLRSKQHAIEKKACQYATSSTENPTVVTKDEIYLVKYTVDRKWYRGRVVGMSERKIDDEESAVIYYLDYGNTEVVPLSRLRSIPPDMLEEPPLAFKCKLFDCLPRDGEWCLESTKTMEKILNNYTATMFVMKVHPECLEVDLSVVYPEGQIGRDIVSVRDALLFLELSTFVNGSKIPQNPTAMKYLHQHLPSVGETFNALITHVNSPSDFYIQRAKQDTSYLYKLTMDLQNFYEESNQKGMIYNPAIGMPCAALFSVDHKWYRAKIIDIPGKKMVSVFYVDYGNKETLPWNRIRKLKESFVRRPPLALNCALAGIRSTDEEWSLQTKLYLEKCVLVKDCRVQIHCKPKSKNRIKVYLYKNVKNKEICVNNLFIEMGYATKVLERSQGEAEMVPKSKAEGKNSNFALDEEQPASDTEEDCVKKTRIFRDRRRNKLSAKKLRELHEHKKKNIGHLLLTEEMEDEVDEYDNIFKVKVDVLSAESPSSVYVTFPALLEELNKLQEKLNEFYQNSSYEVKEWAVGSLCAVYHSTKLNWYRASILNLLPNNQVKLFLKDVAEVITEPTVSLRELDCSFTKYATCAIKCHLADIGPPGDQWPSISSEHLINELENYNEVYMTKKGQIENKSLPIELWVKKIVPKGALEPTCKEWVTLNKLLVNQGLAIPKKSKSWYTGIPSNDECSDEVADSKKVFSEAEGVQKSDDKPIKNEEISEDWAVFFPSLSAKWMPPEPLEKRHFIGVPTYVDLEANVYIHDLEEDAEKLKQMCDSLLSEYEDSKPSPEDHFWSAGQLCIARYHADNCWYRGLILQTNENMTYEVLFVDYGNTETCQVIDLRKRIKMHDIPIIAHKFKLQGVKPISEDGKWPVSVIEILHSLLVDKKCEVTVLDLPSDPSNACTMSLKIMEENIEVSAFLVDQGLAVLTSNRLSNSDSQDSDLLDSSKNQRAQDLPEESPENGCEISADQCRNMSDAFDICLHEDFD